MLREGIVAAVLAIINIAPVLACDSDSFVLRQPFKVGATYPEYKRPEPDDTAEMPDETRKLLHDAFEIAPPAFQRRLCDISGLYVSNMKNTPWSFREIPKQFPPDNQPDSYNRYIAIPIDPPPRLSNYENLIQTALLGGWQGGKLTVNADADTDVMTVLSALAHEDGHLLFRQTHSPVPGGEFRFDRFCDGSYFRGSWKDPVDVEPGFGPFIVKGEHLSDPQIPEIQEAIKQGQHERAAKLLAQLMQGERFINLWTAYSPEHDFVETYRIKVMTEAAVPLRSIKLDLPIGNVSIDLIGRLSRNSEVARKFACFDSFFR